VGFSSPSNQGAGEYIRVVLPLLKGDSDIGALPREKRPDFTDPRLYCGRSAGDEFLTSVKKKTAAKGFVLREVHVNDSVPAGTPEDLLLRAGGRQAKKNFVVVAHKKTLEGKNTPESEISPE